MQFAKRVLMVSGAVAIAGMIAAVAVPRAAHAVAALLVQVTNTSSNPVVATTQTHLGVRPSQLVTLVCTPSFTTCRATDWMRLPADGSALAAFTIPSGQELVVTDFSWSASCCGVEAQAESAALIVFGTDGTGQGPVLNTGVQVYPDGHAAGSEHLTGGVVLSSVPDAIVMFDGGRTGTAAASFEVHGYLVPIS